MVGGAAYRWICGRPDHAVRLGVRLDHCQLRLKVLDAAKDARSERVERV
jgi:hypothetical protein